MVAVPTMLLEPAQEFGNINFVRRRFVVNFHKHTNSDSDYRVQAKEISYYVYPWWWVESRRPSSLSLETNRNHRYDCCGPFKGKSCHAERSCGQNSVLDWQVVTHLPYLGYLSGERFLLRPQFFKHAYRIGRMTCVVVVRKRENLPKIFVQNHLT